MNRLDKRIDEYLDHRDVGYYYAHDFKCKLSLDLESKNNYYILPEDININIKFQMAFNIEAKLQTVFYHLRNGDWVTALFHITQTRADEDLSQSLIDDITLDITEYIKSKYSSVEESYIDMSLYMINKNHTTLIIKRK